MKGWRGMAPAAVGAVVATLVSTAAPGSLSAQEVRFDVAGGRDHVQQGPTSSGASSLLVGLRVLGAERWAGVFTGVPIEDQQALWGAAAGSARLWANRGALRVGIDLTGQFFLQSDREGAAPDNGLGGPPGGLPIGGPLGRPLPVRDEEGPPGGWGAAGDALAVLELRKSRGSVEIRGGASQYRHAFGELTLDRTLPQAHVRTSLAPDRNGLLQFEARRYWADEGTLSRLDATGIARRGAITLWLSAGRWVEGPVTGSPWSFGASFDVHHRAVLVASARREPYDPLYLTPDRTTWNAGISLRFGAPESVRAPVPQTYEAGVATVAISSDGIRGVPRVAGDFNEWQPAPMTRENGRWVFRVRVEPGVYNYAFVDEEGTWFVPESTPGRKPDGFGGHVAVLVVEER